MADPPTSNGGGAEATFPSLHLSSVYALSQPGAGSSINEGHAQRRSHGAGDLACCPPPLAAPSARLPRAVARECPKEEIPFGTPQTAA